ncbi:hypothetical protein EA187_01545 [Lujinxingia sediminis]|uniref:EF-hand domain-containing protein n=1 Tax=Lujinxingia sediminis TaxID=2480984 RepID=A0ABY0CW99_9DELT|nr:hypothetical protein [Lujinxingia sediminis]RVU48149.1 hypothetical protein EA187_01545 [Lujinxingia sediminis]
MQTFPWKFFRSGAVDQVHLTRGEELVRLGELDQKLWVALACPTHGVECDRRTLEFLDADQDRRIRASELIAATQWMGEVLSDVEELARRSDVLPLSAIATSNEEGALLEKTARELLDSLGKGDANEISLQEAIDAIARFDQQAANGDGIVPPKSSSDPDLQALIADIVRCTPDAPVDRSNEPGVNRTCVEAFFKSLTERLNWIEKGQSEAILPLGDATPGAYRAVESVREKIDDYFARARLAAYDERAAAVVNRSQEAYLEATREALSAGADALVDFPLARVEPGRPLPLVEGINPAWTDAVHAFRQLAVEPFSGDSDTLSDEAWSELKTKLSPMRDWMAAEPATQLTRLSEERLREIAESDGRARLEALLDADEARAPQASAIARVEKLLRFNANLLDLANNFVAFQTFYRRQGPAIFQVGTLYIDRRACDLCVHVSNADRHIKLAGHSNAYLLYCDLKNARGETMSIAAAVTDGDVDNLMVGRNGVFYDRHGKDWDATVTRIVDNPISVRQAFWSPYKKALRLLEDQLARRARAAEAKSTKKVEASVAKVDEATSTRPAEPTGSGAVTGTDQPSPPKMDLGTLAAIGVGVGGLTAALSLFLGAFLGLGMWMPLGILGLILLISGPSMLIAWLKLRTRNLGPLLDANGWAINAMARVNVPLGRSLTGIAALPEGASRELHDPFAERKSRWPRYLLGAAATIVITLWWTGQLNTWLPESTHREAIFAPAPAPPTNTPANTSAQAT